VDKPEDFDDCIGFKEQKDRPGSLAGFLGMDEVPETEADAWTEHNYMNWREHWVDMPDFKVRNMEAEKQLIVNFKTQEEFLAFAAVLGQSLTPKTRSVWWPPQERDSNILKRWIDEDDAGEVSEQ
jgi:hypothetical protein